MIIGEHLHDPDQCEHDWQPVSFRFETQMLGDNGKVCIRQPDIEEGRVYLVCLGCAQHTYISTQWAGFQLEGSPHREMKYQPCSSRKYVDWPDQQGDAA